MDVKTGQNRAQPGGFSAFIPDSGFPPVEFYRIPESLRLKLSEADRMLGTLEGACLNVPDFDTFAHMFLVQDATASSQIEGTRATMSEALLHEVAAQNSGPTPLVAAALSSSPSAPASSSSSLAAERSAIQVDENFHTLLASASEDDSDDIVCHKQTLHYGVQRLNEFPLSLRLVREIHQRLMQDGGRSTQYSDPGEFRRSQNFIGGTKPSNAVFVPPPVHEMHQALHEFENFLHNQKMLPLAHAAFMHAQFETIHPFLDGNGRTGRILIALVLHEKKLLSQPVLFLSVFFKRHQQEYYNRLNAYRRGEVSRWLEFFLNGVIDTSRQAVEVAQSIQRLKDTDAQKIQALSKKEALSGAKVFLQLFKTPFVSSTSVMQCTGFTRGGAQKLVDRFVKLNILHPVETKKTRAKMYGYQKYLDLFED